MFRKFIFIFLILLLLACDRSEHTDVPMVNLTHENGLTLSIASDFKNTKIQDRFIVYPEGGLERRSPSQVVVSFDSEEKLRELV
jgi:hypothetical protein